MIIFGLFIVIGVASFALYKGNSSSTKLPAITIWGTFPKLEFDQFIGKANQNSAASFSVTYVEKAQSQFSLDFISALARGQGPDAILIPTDLLLPHEDKLVTVPFTTMTQYDFTNAYIGESSVYLNKTGIIGFPFLVDPLVMYWNMDMFDAAGIATYPRYWDDFTGLNKSLTVKDKNGNIRRSAIAMGQFGNVDNAREILGTLLMQSGNPVTTQNSDGSVSSNITQSADVSPASAIKFFAQFVNPSSANYSWNNSMPDSKSAFLAGSLATYFGFASELSDIKTKNPNLRFDVALMPSPKTGGSGVTYGHMYGFSILRSSSNQAAALQVITSISSPQYLANISNSLYLPSVRRDVIAAGSNDPYITLFDKAALVSKTWLEADPAATSQIFSDMIQSFTSGQSSIDQSINNAGDRMNASLSAAISQ